MDAVLEHIKAFVAKVENDPNLSDLFREAAVELHHALDAVAASGKKKSSKSTAAAQKD